MRTPARILIVDDNPPNVDILSARLESEGYEIVTAGDGEQALEAARAQLPDLILLDVMMSKIDGFQACREIKADANLPFMPIILVTAKADTQDILAGREKDLLVTEEEAREMAYHYIRVHLRDRARPVRFTDMATNGYGEPVWQIDIVDRKQGTPLGQLFIGRDTGSTHDWRPLAV